MDLHASQTTSWSVPTGPDSYYGYGNPTCKSYAIEGRGTESIAEDAVGVTTIVDVRGTSVGAGFNPHVNSRDGYYSLSESFPATLKVTRDGYVHLSGSSCAQNAAHDEWLGNAAAFAPDETGGCGTKDGGPWQFSLIKEKNDTYSFGTGGTTGHSSQLEYLGCPGPGDYLDFPCVDGAQRCAQLSSVGVLWSNTQGLPGQPYNRYHGTYLRPLLYPFPRAAILSNCATKTLTTSATHTFPDSGQVDWPQLAPPSSPPPADYPRWNSTVTQTITLVFHRIGCGKAG